MPWDFLTFPAFLHTLQTFVPAVDGTFPSPVPYKYSVADPGYAKEQHPRPTGIRWGSPA